MRKDVEYAVHLELMAREARRMEARYREIALMVPQSRRADSLSEAEMAAFEAEALDRAVVLLLAKEVH